MRALVEQLGAGHQHAGDAVAALHRAVLDEGPLQRVQFRARCVRARPSMVVRRAPCACAAGTRQDITACAVEPDRAGAALALGAALLRAGQLGVLAQRVEQRLVAGVGPCDRRAVDRRLDCPGEGDAGARSVGSGGVEQDWRVRQPLGLGSCMRCDASASATSAPSVVIAIDGGAAHVVDWLCGCGGEASGLGARLLRRAVCRADTPRRRSRGRWWGRRCRA